MNDEEMQADELLALASIYDERIFIQSSEEKGGQLNIFIDLPKPFQVKVRTKHILKGSRRQTDQEDKRGTKAAQKNDDYNFLEVLYLPPIALNFRFPEDYPSKSPPLFTVSCKWLTVFQVSLYEIINCFITLIT